MRKELLGHKVLLGSLSRVVCNVNMIVMHEEAREGVVSELGGSCEQAKLDGC